VSAEDIKATLEYLVPGFVALKVFYVAGLRTRRSDLGWTTLSVASAAVLNAWTTWLGVTDVSWRVVSATGIGIVVAVIAAGIWRAIRRPLKHLFDRQAWDALFARPSWMQVWLKDGTIILGAPRVFSESAETDSQDIYLQDVSWVDASNGERTPIDGVEGMWVAAVEIRFIQLLAEQRATLTAGIAPEDSPELVAG
jgi:hypothetical protein